MLAISKNQKTGQFLKGAFLSPFLYAAWLAACSGQSTEQYLNGDSFDLSNNRTFLLTPTNKEIVSMDQVFSWSQVPNANSYIIEFAKTNAFNTISLKKELTTTSYTIANADVIGGNTLEATQYFWRVKVKFANKEAVSQLYSVDLLDDAVYVDITTSATTPIGNKLAPYTSIPDAIAFAKLRGKSVKVSKGTYSEYAIRLKPGVAVYGGYDSGNSWSRNVTANVTTISSLEQGPGAVVGVADITLTVRATTILDGFTINALGGFGGETVGVYLYGSSPTISNNKITAGNGPTSSGMIITGSSSPLITGNTISGANGNTYGMNINTNATPIIINNVINGGLGSTGYGVYFSNNAHATLANNTIYAIGTGAQQYAVYISVSNPTITNNIIFTTAGTSRYGVYEADATGDPASFQNNVVFDCPTALYVDHVGTGGNCPADTGRNCYTIETSLNVFGQTTQGATAATASGNVGSATIPNFAAMNFVSASDLHLQLTTPASIRTGGKDTSGSTCGGAGTSSCGGVTTDRDGLTRTLNFSMGAYERD